MISRTDLSVYYPDELSDSASYLAFNPRAVPGEILLVGSATPKDTIGALVAGKLALQHFSQGLLESIAMEAMPDTTSFSEIPERPELALQALELAFKSANSSVYDFGHKLAAGGRLSTTLTSILVSHRTIAAGRVGSGGAYLARTGQLFPFFEQKGDAGIVPTTVGSNALVAVELASVPLQPNDLVLLLSKQLDLYQEQDAAAMLDEMRPYFNDLVQGQADHESIDRMFHELIGRIQSANQETGQAGDSVFAMLAMLGPDNCFLKKVVHEPSQSNFGV